MKKRITAFLTAGIIISAFAQETITFAHEAFNPDTSRLHASLQIKVMPASCSGNDGSIEVILHFITLFELNHPDFTQNATAHDEYIILHEGNSAFWKAKLTSATGLITEKTAPFRGTVVFRGLAGGTYAFELTGKQGYRIYKEIAVKGPPVVSADFEANFTAVQVNDEIYFRNRSTGATTHEWNFGDGSPVSNSKNAAHYFKQPGIYEVALTASNNDCAAEKSILITVTGEDENLPSGTAGMDAPGAFYAYAEGEYIGVALQYTGAETARLSIFDLSGRQLADGEVAARGASRIHLPFPASGWVVVRVALRGQSFMQKLLIARD